jgi:hypothetical protein
MRAYILAAQEMLIVEYLLTREIRVTINAVTNYIHILEIMAGGRMNIFLLLKLFFVTSIQHRVEKNILFVSITQI